VSRPPFDVELSASLRVLGAEVGGTLTADLIPRKRAQLAQQAVSDAVLERGGAIELERRRIPGPDGAPELDALICRPRGPLRGAAGVLHLHGGGMVMGDYTTGIDIALDWVQQLGVVVVSPNYRLAPEHPDPAPVSDCYAALLWLAVHAEEVGVDPRRLIVAGASAGAGLAAGVTLMARDRGGPGLAGQILMCPMLDDRNETPSSYELDGEGVWDRGSNLTGWSALLGDRSGTADVSPYAAPARCTDLSGLPPTLIDVGSVETFRDEAVAYASRIWAQGGDAELHVWPGGFHGFDLLVPQAALSQATRNTRTNWLQRLLDTA
jgi:acetyl esterase/lipase